MPFYTFSILNKLNDHFKSSTFGVLSIFGLLGILIITSIPTIITEAEVAISPYNADKVNPKEKNWYIFQAEAGSVVANSILIQNTGETNSEVSISGKDAQILENGNLTIIPDNQENKSAGNWIELDVSKVAIESKKSSQVGFKINIPKDTQDGEYASGIGVSEVVKTSPQNNIIKRQGLRIYTAVGKNFDLNIQAEKLNILDPRDPNYQQIREQKSYFGRNNLLLEFEAENQGNVFGLMQGKYSLVKPDGSIFENNFELEIAPKTGKRKYYLITNQEYFVGTTKVILDYKTTPENIPTDKVKNLNPKSAYGDSLTLSQNQWDNFETSKAPAFISKGEIYSPQNTNVTPVKTSLFAPILLTVLVNLFGIYVGYKKHLFDTQINKFGQFIKKLKNFRR